jgi:tellurite resistance protein TehA-like permease
MKQHSLGLLDNLKKNIADLFPSYFALTMATGIVSIACHLSGIPFVGELLLYLNIIFYSILWMLLVCRVIFYFQNFAKDISDHARGSGFLTVVAGTNVLGTQFVVIGQNYQVAVPLYYLGLILWVVLIYSFFIIITVKSNKPSLEKGINGIWLLMVVATQSVSVLGTLLVEHLPFSKELTLFLSLTFFLFGCILYIILITLIFYRLTFFELRAEEFAPPYWINMGAVAIITLAGSVLILNSNHWELLAHLKPFFNRVYADVLGYSHLVDSYYCYSWTLETCVPVNTPDLPSAILGNDISVRYVYSLHLSVGPGNSNSIPV